LEVISLGDLSKLFVLNDLSLINKYKYSHGKTNNINVSFRQKVSGLLRVIPYSSCHYVRRNERSNPRLEKESSEEDLVVDK